MEDNEITEISSEIEVDITEEIEEENTELDYSQYFENIQERLDEISLMLAENSEEVTEEFTEEVTEEITEEVTEEFTEHVTEGLVINGSGTGDFNLYLSGQVENATINDIFSMAVSIRNILLIFFLFWVLVKLLNMFKGALYRLMNR